MMIPLTQVLIEQTPSNVTGQCVVQASDVVSVTLQRIDATRNRNYVNLRVGASIQVVETPAQVKALVDAIVKP